MTDCVATYICNVPAIATHVAMYSPLYIFSCMCSYITVHVYILDYAEVNDIL